jgi:hypothetical protein
MWHLNLYLENKWFWKGSPFEYRFIIQNSSTEFHPEALDDALGRNWV